MFSFVGVRTGVGGVSLREDEILEVDDADGLSPKPAIRNGFDVILRR